MFLVCKRAQVHACLCTDMQYTICMCAEPRDWHQVPSLIAPLFYEIGSLSEHGTHRFCQSVWARSTSNPSVSVSPALVL